MKITVYSLYYSSMRLIDIGICPSLYSDTDTISQTCGVYRQLFHFIMLKKRWSTLASTWWNEVYTTFYQLENYLIQLYKNEHLKRTHLNVSELIETGK